MVLEGKGLSYEGLGFYPRFGSPTPRTDLMYCEYESAQGGREGESFVNVRERELCKGHAYRARRVRQGRERLLRDENE